MRIPTQIKSIAVIAVLFSCFTSAFAHAESDTSCLTRNELRSLTEKNRAALQAIDYQGLPALERELLNLAPQVEQLGDKVQACLNANTGLSGVFSLDDCGEESRAYNSSFEKMQRLNDYIKQRQDEALQVIRINRGLYRECR